MDNNYFYGNIMQEIHIVKELEGSIEQLLPVPGLEVLIEHGRGVQWDLRVRANYQGLQFDLIIEVVSANNLPVFRDKINRLKSSVQENDVVPVLAAPYLSPERQALCREAGIYFMDLSGNVFVAHQSLYVERIGFPNKYPEKRQRRYPFSDKASLILRELLKAPERQWGIRELAGKIGLNPGYVSRMAKSLSAAGYASQAGGKLKIRSAKEILDDWIRAYDLKRNEHHRLFMLAPDVNSILRRLREIDVHRKVQYALSVQAGAGLVAPYAAYKEVHIYVGDAKDIEFFKKEMDLKDADQGANVVLMIPYYRHSAFYDSREVEGLWVVSDIQLYLDLYGYPVRGREQAEHLYAKRLEMLFSGNEGND
ncbi:MAG: type IV toxin-antitoxin system AbiEi family antitoxin [Desulfobacteraceae bacterium]